jgi:MYXO-CTERM domain-containing protein
MWYLLYTASSLACGGFFCNNTSPVEQAGEQIAFILDPSGTVTVHVRVAYSGPSESFAWVVPVPAVPELGVSSNGLFDALSAATAPTHVIEYEAGECGGYYAYDVDYSASGGGPSSYGYSDTGVVVLDSTQVGPYQTVTLASSSPEALTNWLIESGYDVPPAVGPAIAPYVADGMYLLALKLTKDSDVGDIAPIVMSYPGTTASIPIQLTSVAASPDMPLEVYVFGQSRAVPTSYYHVIPNPFAYDWFTGTVDWQDTIGRAADEAGGHAFATDFSGDTSRLQGSFYQGQWDGTLVDMRAAGDAIAWWRIVISNFPASTAILDVFREFIPMPATVTVDEQSFYNALDYYAADLASQPFDPVAATDALEAAVVQPLRDAEQLVLDAPHLSRLTSSLDAREMTVDPIFELNADMDQEVSNLHTGSLAWVCDADDSAMDAPRTFTVAPEGYTVALPSSSALQAMGLTEYEYLQSLTTFSALRIEQTSATGDPETVSDQSAWLEEQIALLGGEATDDPVAADDPAAGGCGCATGATGGGWTLLALVPIALRRRRTATV